MVGLLEAFLMAYFLNTKGFMDYMNEQSEIKAGKWWLYSIKIIVPVILFVALIYNTYKELRSPYEGYPSVALVFGFSFLIVLLIISILLSKKERSV